MVYGRGEQRYRILSITLLSVINYRRHCMINSARAINAKTSNLQVRVILFCQNKTRKYMQPFGSILRLHLSPLSRDMPRTHQASIPQVPAARPQHPAWTLKQLEAPTHITAQSIPSIMQSFQERLERYPISAGVPKTYRPTLGELCL